MFYGFRTRDCLSLPAFCTCDAFAGGHARPDNEPSLDEPAFATGAAHRLMTCLDQSGGLAFTRCCGLRGVALVSASPVAFWFLKTGVRAICSGSPFRLWHRSCFCENHG